jgi:hypothetical protein
MSNNETSLLNSIEFIQSLFDISWILMDYTRDKRYPIGEGQIKPKKGVPKEVLQALVNLNSLTSHILATYNKPPEDHDGEIPTDLVDTIDVSDK